MKKSKQRKEKKVQGSCLIFELVEEGHSSKLNVSLLKERSVSVKTAEGIFIDNTVLAKTPAHCFGLLIAYTTETGDNLEELKKLNWKLGVLLHLHPNCTIINPLVCKKRQQIDKKEIPWCYIPCKETIVFNCFEKGDTLQIRYLNCIPRAQETSDGFVEESVSGPDVLKLPILEEKITNEDLKTSRLYNLQRPSYPTRNF